MKKLRPSRALLRKCASIVLVQEGFVVKEKTGVGIEPGGRLKISGPGMLPQTVAVRTSRERKVSFSKDVAHEHWRTLSKVDRVAMSVPSYDGSGDIDVILFEAEVLSSALDQIFEQQQSNLKGEAERSAIFIDLGEDADAGSTPPNLLSLALWKRVVSASRLSEIASAVMKSSKLASVAGAHPALPSTAENFIDRVRREYADLIGGVYDKIVVKFEHLP